MRFHREVAQWPVWCWRCERRALPWRAVCEEHAASLRVRAGHPDPELGGKDVAHEDAGDRRATLDCGEFRAVAATYCPPELVGTAWDPVIADGSPIQTSPRSKSIHEPIKVATFEV
jgi:hypothetical protein